MNRLGKPFVPDTCTTPDGYALLVTGARTVVDKQWVFARLDQFVSERAPDARLPELLLHGGARGVDTLAGEWAEARGIAVAHTDSPRVYRRHYPAPRHQKNNRAFMMRDLDLVDRAAEVVFLGESPASSDRARVLQYARDYQKLRACYCYRQ